MNQIENGSAKKNTMLGSWIDTNLSGVLKQFARERQEIKKMVILIGLLICVTAVIVFFFANSNVPRAVAAILAFCAVGYSAYRVHSYKKKYKTHVFGKVIQARIPGIQYAPESYIDEGTFVASKVCWEHFNRYRGEDLFTGSVDGVPIKFSELTIQHEVKKKDRNEVRTVFSGVFYQAEFNKNLSHFTIVRPDASQGVGGVAGWVISKVNDGLQSLSSLPPKVKLEDPRFEAAFDVRGTDQIEARYCLTASFMERLMAVRDKLKEGSISISFQGRFMSMAIATSKNRFEPKIFGSQTDEQQIREFLEDIEQFLSIVKTLKLNEHLWTKPSLDKIA